MVVICPIVWYITEGRNNAKKRLWYSTWCRAVHWVDDQIQLPRHLILFFFQYITGMVRFFIWLFCPDSTLIRHHAGRNSDSPGAPSSCRYIKAHLTISRLAWWKQIKVWPSCPFTSRPIDSWSRAIKLDQITKRIDAPEGQSVIALREYHSFLDRGFECIVRVVHGSNNQGHSSYECSFYHGRETRTLSSEVPLVFASWANACARHRL